MFSSIFFPTFLVLSLSSPAAAAPSLPPRASCAATSAWPGFAGLNHAFVFGDSYTKTGFNTTLAAPSSSNPFGNPVSPETAANGANWIVFLTTTYNASGFLTYNLAYGGATLDAALVAPYEPTVLSVKDQVQTLFLPTYGNATFWSGSDSLFLFFDGINDVAGSYVKGAAATSSLNNEVFAVYRGLVDEVYAAGARNFAFLTTPPVDRSPEMLAVGKVNQTLKADIADWNEKVSAMATALKASDPDVNVWLVDANRLFTEVLDNPAAFPQTVNLKNTTEYCVAYKDGTPHQDTFIASCGVPVNQYFWLNSLHPTYPMHDVLGQGVSEVLKADPNIC